MQDFAMGNGCYNMMAAVLLLMNFEKTRAVLDYCSKCKPGTFCMETNQTCGYCPEDSFSSTAGQRSCKPCRSCVGVFKVKKACSATSDTECECTEGYRCLGAECNMCAPSCQPGGGAAGAGACAQGTQLKPSQDCGFGTFRDSRHGTCRPWTDCSLAGKSVLVNGTKDRDVICGPPLAGLSPGHIPRIVIVFLALTSTMVLVLLVLFALRFSAVKHSRKKILNMVKQPFMKPVQVAQEEDGCSCRCPEEEEYEI
ncbi:tumor necrosis factor receptor superfamily member 9 [Talpa occidentalis]|uniref:tumor necrosis factor receptor superfamily member 9 n=1 Tax=Talpa occidentalis TaxID=50954 RepID=UPI00188E2AE2|nr:tumor necrosis factor receptor superfamily member 9 [Talpa occidentalis]